MTVVVAQSAPEEAPLNSEKVPNHTMDEARLEEIMANLAANHQKKKRRQQSQPLALLVKQRAKRNKHRRAR
jgi:hypothetical protein